MHPSLRHEIMIAVVVVYLTGSTSALNYKELEDLGVSCAPKDSCVNITSDDEGTFNGTFDGEGTFDEDTFDDRTCECRPSCSKRGTCCIDSPYVDINAVQVPQKCIHVNDLHLRCKFNYGIWVVTECSPRWSGSSFFKELCEGDAVKLRNFLVLIPAYNPVSQLTYRNYFCAICNNDDKDAVLWDVTAANTEKRTFLEPCLDQNNVELEYDDSTGSWGHRNRFTPGKSMFIPIWFHVEPTRENDKCRGDMKDIVWGCAASWEDDAIRKKCEAYVGLIQGPVLEVGDEYVQRIFRNVHCAVCNYVTNFDHFVCQHYFDSRTTKGGCGGAIDGLYTVLNIFASNIALKQCREVNDTYYKNFRGCRPTFSRSGNH